MLRFLLTILNIIYVIYLVIISIIYELIVPFWFLVFKLRKSGRTDDFFRIHNWKYGRLLVKGSWPYIRRLVPIPNQMVVVRNWVFDLKLFGWSMHLAKYPVIDETPPEKLKEICRALVKQNVSFQFYPEAHRSHDAKLLRFRRGAFMIAVDNDIPVVPVCMIGTNDFGSYKFPFFKPARIKMEILDPVWPKDFEPPRRSYQIKKHVEKIYREYFGE
ncbi:MAG: lysophospholipid acyltransferase family protein [Calditrichaceae bacterium]